MLELPQEIRSLSGTIDDAATHSKGDFARGSSQSKKQTEDHGNSDRFYCSSKSIVTDEKSAAELPIVSPNAVSNHAIPLGTAPKCEVGRSLDHDQVSAVHWPRT